MNHWFWYLQLIQMPYVSLYHTNSLTFKHTHVVFPPTLILIRVLWHYPFYEILWYKQSSLWVFSIFSDPKIECCCTKLYLSVSNDVQRSCLASQGKTWRQHSIPGNTIRSRAMGRLENGQHSGAHNPQWGPATVEIVPATQHHGSCLDLMHATVLIKQLKKQQHSVIGFASNADGRSFSGLASGPACTTLHRIRSYAHISRYEKDQKIQSLFLQRTNYATVYTVKDGLSEER